MTAIHPPVPRAHPPAPGLPAVLIAGVAGAIVLFGLAPDGAPGEIAFLVTYAAAAALAWVGVARHPRERRAPWAHVAAAATVTMVGDLTYEVVLGAPPGATASDVLWLGAYGLLLIGLLRIEPIRLGGRVDVDAVIDTSVALVVGVVVAWEVVLDGLVVEAGSSALDRVVSGAYPLLDVVLLAVVIRLLLRGERSRPILLASAGSIVLLLTDLAFATTAGGSADTALTLGWMIALLLLASSTLPVAEQASARPSERLRLWLVVVPVGVPIAFLLRGQITHDHPNTGLMLATTVTLLALAAVRSQRLLRAVDEARQEIQAREHLYRALTANAADAVCISDPDGVLIHGEESLARLLGVEPEQVAGVSAHDEQLLVDPPAVQRLLRRVQDAPGVVLQQEIEVRRPDGTHRWWDVTMVDRLDDPVVGGIVSNLRDVTDRHHDQERLRYQTFHDVATGLANRALLRDRVEHAMRRGARRGTDPAVLHLQVVGLRSATDRAGHDCGDRLLQQVADRMRGTVRSEDTIARIGPHELAVLVEENHPDTAEAATTAERLTQVMRPPFRIDGHEVELTALIGLAVADADTTADALLRNAATALEQARDDGPDVVAYRTAMGAAATERAVLRGTLPGAVDRQELELTCEPLVRLSDDAVVGYECQGRWQHPMLGPLPPRRFRAVAEESDAALAIGRWLLDTACAAASMWPADGPVSVGVDLSARHLLSDHVVDDVRRALERSGLTPSRLVLEVTETALVRDTARTAERLPALSALGVRIAVDDFGTGYSSLALLRQLPVDLVKVDASFVETIDEDHDEAAGAGGAVPPIVRGLLDLAATLDLEVVAQGVSRPAQAGALRAAGCDLAQGPLFSGPSRRPVVAARRARGPARPASRSG